MWSWLCFLNFWRARRFRGSELKGSLQLVLFVVYHIQQRFQRCRYSYQRPPTCHGTDIPSDNVDEHCHRNSSGNNGNTRSNTLRMFLRLCGRAMKATVIDSIIFIASPTHRVLTTVAPAVVQQVRVINNTATALLKSALNKKFRPRIWANMRLNLREPCNRRLRNSGYLAPECKFKMSYMLPPRPETQNPKHLTVVSDFWTLEGLCSTSVRVSEFARWWTAPKENTKFPCSSYSSGCWPDSP